MSRLRPEKKRPIAVVDAVSHFLRVIGPWCGLRSEYDRPVAHTTCGADGRQEGRERGYYHLHRQLDDTLLLHGVFYFIKNLSAWLCRFYKGDSRLKEFENFFRGVKNYCFARNLRFSPSPSSL